MRGSETLKKIFYIILHLKNTLRVWKYCFSQRKSLCFVDGSLAFLWISSAVIQSFVLASCSYCERAAVLYCLIDAVNHHSRGENRLWISCTWIYYIIIMFTFTLCQVWHHCEEEGGGRSGVSASVHLKFQHLCVSLSLPLWCHKHSLYLLFHLCFCSFSKGWILIIMGFWGLGI